MMPAAKHGDPQLGVDIHLCVVPPSPSPVPLPTPHTSIVFDPFDYVPVLGATVTVCGMKRATAGTGGIAIHIPPGFPFAPKLPDKDDELFMGSSTVVADGDPFSYIALPVLSCQVAGMMSPFRPKKKGGPKAMVLPTVFNLAIPTSVFVGGPPTISLMGMAFKGAFAALGKFAKSGLFKRVRQKLFKNMKPGFLKCKVLRAEPVNILTGEVVVEHEDFTVAGRIQLEWPRTYSSSNGHAGACGLGWETPADIRLDVDPLEGTVAMRHPTAGPLFFAALPAAAGDEGAELELMDGAQLTDAGEEFRVRTKDDRTYHFPKELATVEASGAVAYPIGRIADSCGNGLVYERRGGRVTAIQEPAGRRIEIVSDGDRISEIALTFPGTDSRFVLVRYQYDAAGHLVAAIDVLGAAYRFVYVDHRLVRHTDRNGLSFHYEYEASSAGDWRVVHSWGDGGLYAYRFAYDDVLRERRITDSLGHVWLVKLDERELPIAEIDPLGGMTMFEYDEAGRTTAVVDPGGRRTEYHHDQAGNVVKLVFPDGAALTTAFDSRHKPLAIQAPGGGVWRQAWDDRGLLVEQITPLGHRSRYEYDPSGQLVGYTNARGATTTLRYDGLGLVTELTDALGQRLVLGRDRLGRIVAKVDGPDRHTSYTYDAKGRLTRVVRPSGATIACEYDPADNLVRFTNEEGATTRLEYTGLGQIARRVQADGHTVSYAYDSEERLVSVRNQRGEVYEFHRDAFGNVIEEVDYWGQRRRYVYDEARCLTASIDPLGRRTDYVTDPRGRITRKLLPADESGNRQAETFVYDPNGVLLEAANGEVTIQRTMDPEGRLLLEVQRHADGHQFVVENVYDAQGNRIRRTTGGESGPGHIVEFTYDLLDQVVGVDIDGRGAARLEHDAAGRLIREELAEDLDRRFAYDAEGRMAAQEVSRGGATLFVTRYEYDAVGNLTKRHDTQLGTDVYRYDPIGRIREHVDPQGVLRQFLFSPAGDRLTTPAAGDGAPSGIEGRPDDWRREGHHEGQYFRFDRAGNLVAKANGRHRVDLTWDGNQRLAAARVARGTAASTTTYGYDPLGRRIFKETLGRRTRFAWDGLALLADAVDGQVREFVYRPGSVVPWYVMNTSAGVTDRRAYLTDPNGMPTRLIDSRGHTSWVSASSPHAAIAAPPDDVQPLRAPGQYSDLETELVYNLHRYFDPDLDAYASPDPIGLLGGTNPYAYGPNSIGWTDPLGLAGAPHGFKSFGQFQQFGEATQGGLAAAGYPGTTPFLQGSAVTGVSHDTGIPFDVGRTSDFDVALAGDSIFAKADELGLAKGTRTGPIKMGSEEAKALGIDDTLQKLSRMAGGREVNVMIFKDAADVKAKGPSLRMPCRK